MINSLFYLDNQYLIRFFINFFKKCILFWDQYGSQWLYYLKISNDAQV